MNKVRATVASKSKKVSLRKCPWDPFKDMELAKSFKPGEQFRVNTDHKVYDWRGNEFYEVYDLYLTGDLLGYVNVTAIELNRGGTNYGRNSSSNRQHPANNR